MKEKTISIAQLHECIYDGTKKLKPDIGDVFFINIKQIGHIPGMVAGVRIDKSENKTFLIYIYNEILKSKEEIPVLDKYNLLFSPLNVLRNNWSKGLGFEHRFSLPKEKIDVFQDHCFYSKLHNPPRYHNQNGESCEPFEPLVDNVWNNITTICIKILKKIDDTDIKN